ncbi:uncharacterized protein LOC131669877 [Phymastichus coffea]|uniref:uncharacterized protein LOC131669877 n=1 Tax=Phymastichus coffea TaxID=108790 RepID=UPI00273CA8F3|nr:uncharacterized protein LOC131669877 [Phymastichus coffea]
MNIYKYIESCTKINTDREVDNIEWLSVPKIENINLLNKRNLPYCLESEKGFYVESHMDNLDEIEHQSDGDISEQRYQFADIRASVREVGLGWNIFNIIEKRYRESQERYTEKSLDKSSSESDCSYTTAYSVLSNDSYSTAIDEIEYPRRASSSADIKSEILIDSSIDKRRYRKNALMTRLLQSAENNLSYCDQILIDYSTDKCDTSNLIHDVCNKKTENKNISYEKLESNNSDKNTYEDNVLRLFQSKEDEDVYVHPLREQIQNDHVWQEFRLSRKGIVTTETARQYYMNLSEDQFAVFEQIDSKKKSSNRRKVKNYITTGRE